MIYRKKRVPAKPSQKVTINLEDIMRRHLTKTAAIAMSAMMAAGLLAGCGSSKLDGNKTAVTVNGTEIPMGVVSLGVRYSQASMEAMYSYFGYRDFWDTVADEESGQTMGQQQVDGVLTQIENEEIYRQKAADYGIEITADDQKKIDEAAAAFMAANSEETIEVLGCTEDHVKTYLELQMIQSRMNNALRDEATVEVSDDEANQTTFTYISIAAPEETAEETEEAAEETTETAEDTAEETADEAEEAAEETADKAEEAADAAEETAEKAADAAEETAEKAADAAEETAEKAADAAEETAEKAADTAEEAAEETAGEAAEDAEAEEETEAAAEDAEAAEEEHDHDHEAETEEEAPEKTAEELKADLQSVLDHMLEDPEDDLHEYAETIDESFHPSTGHFTTVPSDEDENSTYPQEVLDVLRTLGDGEYAPELVEANDHIYLLQVNNINDEEATAEQRESLENTQRSEYVTETTEKWHDEADIKVDEKVLSKLTVTNNHKFTVVTPEPEETVEETAEEAVEDAAETVDAAADTAEEAVEDAAETVDAAADTAEEAVEDAAETVTDAAEDTAEAVEDAAETAADAAEDAANN